MIWPYTSTEMLSASSNTTPMSCSMIISVRPSVSRRISATARSVSGVAHAGGRLVEQDDVGAAGDGDADLERALLGIGEQPAGTSRREVRHVDEFEDFPRCARAPQGDCRCCSRTRMC